MKSQTAFMQNQGQILSNHLQVISRLEMQMSQLASSLSERLKGTLPSQPLVNPKNSNQAYEFKILRSTSAMLFIHFDQERRWTTRSTNRKILSTLVLLLPPHLLGPLNLLRKRLKRTQLLNKFISL